MLHLINMKTPLASTFLKCLGLLLLITTFSCKDDGPEPIVASEEALQGQWHMANEYYKYYDANGKLLYQVSGVVVVAYYEFKGDTLEISSRIPDRNNNLGQRSHASTRFYEVGEKEGNAYLTIFGFGAPNTYQLIKLNNNEFIKQIEPSNTSFYVKDEGASFTADKAIYQVVFRRGFTHGTLPARTSGRPK